VLSNVASDASARSSTPRWTAREAEILAVTLELLQQHGYDRLTMEAVAARARASKATVYRRWPSKADLVLAAFIEGTQSTAVAPRTGSLREDLVSIGNSVSRQACKHATTMRAVLNEMSHNPALAAAMQTEFVHQRRLMMSQVLAEAVDRGEIDAAAVDEDISDLLPGYLVFRTVVSGRPPTEDTIATLVDDVLLPMLKGSRGQ